MEWYEEVEKLVKSFHDDLNVPIENQRSNGLGGHRRHEAVLETLSDPANLLHELLGTGKAFDYLHQARKYRNVWRKTALKRCG